jgi:signal transduction histidine kinase
MASTRLRVTVVAVIVVGVALLAGGWVIDSRLRQSAQDDAKGSAAREVGWVQSLGASGVLPRTLPPLNAARVMLIQVVDARQRVVAASSQLAGLDYDASTNDPAGVRLAAARGEMRNVKGGPWFVDAANATVGGKPVTVIAFTSLSEFEGALDSVDEAAVIALPVLLALVAAASWLLVGRSLGPVERMRREVDVITAGNLDARVVEPSSADEVGRLAVTLNSMLERLQRSSDRQRRFIADASHELRTPVANVTAALDIANRYPDRTVWPDVADDIGLQVQRLQGLVDDLLLIARRDHTDPLPPSKGADLATVVRSEIDHLQPNARSLVRVVGHLDDTPASIATRDAARVVANLLDNATRHAASCVEVSVERAGDDLVLTVADDGPGVPPDQRERVFEPFVRLDRHRARRDGGAGLGLAIVCDLLHDVNGHVAVFDSPLGGAAFVATIPAAGSLVTADPSSEQSEWR